MQDSLLSRFDLLFIVLDQVGLSSCILSIISLNFLALIFSGFNLSFIL